MPPMAGLQDMRPIGVALMRDQDGARTKIRRRPGGLRAGVSAADDEHVAGSRWHSTAIVPAAKGPAVARVDATRLGPHGSLLRRSVVGADPDPCFARGVLGHARIMSYTTP